MTLDPLVVFAFVSVDDLLRPFVRAFMFTIRNCLRGGKPCKAYCGFGHTVIGELHFRLRQYPAAECAWQEALRSTPARADREFLLRRLGECQPDGNEPAT
jgi:hypothetical protein